MTTSLDPTLLPALDAVIGALEQPRRYAIDPAADESDYHAKCLRAELNRNADLRERLRMERDGEQRFAGPDAVEFFHSEQSPSDASFR